MRFFPVVLALCLLTPGNGADFFVATNGNDSWSGKLAAPNAAKTDGPFASPATAQLAARATAHRPLTVMVGGGTYYLPATLSFTSSDSGVSWVNYPGETPILSGGIPVGKGGLGLTWGTADPTGRHWQVALPDRIRNFEHLFYNGARRLRTRVQSPAGTGYYMRGGSCYSTVTKRVVGKEQCNLGTFLRIASPVSPDDPAGAGCPTVTNPANGRRKCLDRFYYRPEDPVAVWANLNPTNTEWHACGLPSSSYPQGDIEVTIFNSWSVDMMRVSCIDTERHVIYFTGRTFHAGRDTFNNFGPIRNHRYVVENTSDAFGAAYRAGQTGVWFLDRSGTRCILNYIVNRGENPNADTVVIPQLEPVSRLGGSLLSATELENVTFRGLTFEMDSYVPPPSGFNNDQNTEFTLPVALDCENCRHVIFDGFTVRHTATSGILIASSSGNSGNPAKNDIIQNSAFYDIGDCGIRIGHGATRGDKAEFVVQSVTVRNNIVQGYSRVFPDGEGIALSNGHNIEFVHNDIGDGYHTGLAVCFLGCLGDNHKANGSNVLSAYNHIWDSMQGLTSDGGTLYYNVGDADGSATGNKILNNLVHDTTDAGIIDGFPDGYGGRGIYLDNQTAGVLVENNVVYRMNQDVVWMSRGPAPGQPGHIFRNNIFAYGRRSMFHGVEWPAGCKEPSIRATITNNIFYFDRTDEAFHIMQGCSYSCGLPYNQFLNFQGNLYWRTDGTLAADPKAFHIITNAPADARRCTGGPNEWTYLSFSQWQGKQQPVPWGPPGGMNLDTTGTAAVDPKFGHTGQPSDFLLRSNPVAGFDYTKTNDTIQHAGRDHPLIKVPPVPATFPTYRSN